MSTLLRGVRDEFCYLLFVIWLRGEEDIEAEGDGGVGFGGGGEPGDAGGEGVVLPEEAGGDVVGGAGEVAETFKQIG